MVVNNGEMKAKVINALRKAQLTSLKNCEFKLEGDSIAKACNYPNGLNSEFSVLLNESVIYFALQDEVDFEKMSLQFQSALGEMSSQMQFEWNVQDFRKVEDGEELFYLAAKQKITQLVDLE